MINTKNLEILAKYLEENFSEISNRLRMSSWFSVGEYPVEVDGVDYDPYEECDLSEFKELSHSCNTTACIAGWSAVSGVPELTEKQNSLENMLTYIEKTFGIAHNSVEFDFLFVSDWPDDLEQGILRIRSVAENGCIPEDWDNNYNYWIDPSSV